MKLFNQEKFYKKLMALSAGTIVPAIFAAILLILSYPKFNQGYLAWVALAPFTVAIWRSKTAAGSAKTGFTAGFIFYAGILCWIYPTMRSGGVNALVSLLGLAALSSVMALEFVLAATVGFYLKKAGLRAWPFVFATFWALLEYSKVLLSLKAIWFPWYMLGYTQWEYLPIIQSVSVFGVYGLSAMLCFTGSLVGTVYISSATLARKLLRLFPAVLLLAGLLYYGNRELNLSARFEMKGIDVALLQPSISLYDKWDSAKAGGIFELLEKFAVESRGADLAVWPENALPCWIDEPSCADWLKNTIVKSSAPAVVGSVSKGAGRHVSAYFLDASGGIIASYNKRRLVPFGEFVPFRSFLGKFIAPIAALGEFDAGSLRQPLFQLDGRKAAPVICYESIFPYLFSGDTLSGADYFVNITNDGWYLDTAAPYQHLVANIFRAVETRRSVARAANNGISAVIDPWGRIIAQKQLNERGVLRAKIPVFIHTEQTIFVRYGKWFLLACLLPVSAFLLAIILV